ncbi:MAG: 16S rRNA (cytosine(1402)-N(4))-methyltransferase RsmH [Gammaproteobacteria bacterium]|nr:16S rRNA (cytosine(1402)-N(4))-methyltransferase RsmH [Gammaproteobacteria bacterium]
MSINDQKDLGSHQPVLFQQVLRSLNLHADGLYVDCTFGRGGHAREILRHLGAEGRLQAMDLDPQAVQSGDSLQEADPRFSITQGSFTLLTQQLKIRGWQGKVDGLLFDLGVSSPQLDDAARGFSFMRDGPLDMRMDPQAGDSARDWLARVRQEEIAEILFRYGDERYSRRIARAIVAARRENPIRTTAQLAKIISVAHPAWKTDRHPATKSFQAIRIFINRELEALQSALNQVPAALAPGGRLAVISFHSLEDRLVKRFIRDQAHGDRFPSKVPVTAAQCKQTLRAVGKPVYASEEEVRANPRARSAVLRVAERL